VSDGDRTRQPAEQPLALRPGLAGEHAPARTSERLEGGSQRRRICVQQRVDEPQGERLESGVVGPTREPELRDPAGEGVCASIRWNPLLSVVYGGRTHDREISLPGRICQLFVK
jgi:hypothetical protein